MEFCYALMAENADVLADGKYFIFKGGIEVLNCPSIPCAVPSLALVTRLRILPPERNSGHVVEVKSIGPNNEEFAPVMLHSFMSVNDNIPADRAFYHTFMITFQGIVIHAFGRHRFSIAGDGAHLGDAIFYADPVPAVPGQEPHAELRKERE